MKKTTLLSITLYQRVLSSIRKQLFGMQLFCRYNPTFYAYAREVIQKKELYKGAFSVQTDYFLPIILVKYV